MLRTSTDDERETRSTRDSFMEWKNKEIKQLQLKIQKLSNQLELYKVGVGRMTHT